METEPSPLAKPIPLSKKLEIKTESPAERKALMLSLVISILIMIVGFSWATLIGAKTLPLQHALGHKAEDIENMRKRHSTAGGAVK